MKFSFARAVSFILNPLMITILAPFIVVYRSTYDLGLAIHWTLYTLIFIMVLGIFVAICVQKKVFTDLDVSQRQQRPLMFFVSILFCTIYLASIFVLSGPAILIIFAASVVLGISIAYIINTKIKASMHVAAITAFTLPLAMSTGYYYLLLLIPFLAWARLTTKRHTLPEVLVGGTVGGVLSFSIYVAVKFFLAK